MYKASIQQKEKESTLVLTDRESEWTILSIDGITSPAAQINLTAVAGMDGALLNSCYLQPRNIVIMLKLSGDVDTSRHTLERYFRTGTLVRFLYETPSRKVYCDGVVQTIECGLFSSSVIFQVTLICPDPYLYSDEDIVTPFVKVMNGVSFPISIEQGHPIPFSEVSEDHHTDVENITDTSTGFILTATVQDTFGHFTLKSLATGEQVEVDYPFSVDDILTIDTRNGKKSVMLTRGDDTITIMDHVSDNSVFFSLQPGLNRLAYFTNQGDADVECIYRPQWRSV